MKYAGKIAGLALSGLMLMSAPLAYAADELVANGGFELSDYDDLGNSIPFGWVLNTGDYGIVTGSYGPNGSAHGGVQDMLFQQAGSLAYLSQDLSTTANTQYNVSFWLASDGATPNQMQVTWGGETLLPTSSLSVMDWTQYFFTVTAQSALTTLSFGGQYDLNGAQYLDDVSVTAVTAAAVPEPASYLLLLAGLGMLGVTARRRARA
jgi:hypothetical protein